MWTLAADGVNVQMLQHEGSCSFMLRRLLAPSLTCAQADPILTCVLLLVVGLGVVAAVAAGVLLLWCRRRNRMHKLPEGEDAMKGTMYHDISLHSRQSG
jgi:hypothetical protein